MCTVCTLYTCTTSTVTCMCTYILLHVLLLYTVLVTSHVHTYICVHVCKLIVIPSCILQYSNSRQTCPQSEMRSNTSLPTPPIRNRSGFFGVTHNRNIADPSYYNKFRGALRINKKRYDTKHFDTDQLWQLIFCCVSMVGITCATLTQVE